MPYQQVDPVGLGPTLIQLRRLVPCPVGRRTGWLRCQESDLVTPGQSRMPSQSATAQQTARPRVERGYSWVKARGTAAIPAGMPTEGIGPSCPD